MTMYRSHTSKSDNAKDIATPKIPRGLRELPIASASSLTDQGPDRFQLKNEASDIDKWFADPRWKHTKRVYNGTLLYTTNTDIADGFENIY
jgi:hypothetical protein